MGFTEHAFYRPIPRDPGQDADEEPPMLAAPFPALDPALGGPARLLDLASRALADLARDAELDPADLHDAALLLSLPALDPAVETWNLGRDFVPALRDRTRLPFEEVRVVQTGAAGMFELLGDASRLLGDRSAPRCVLLGVDSYLAADRLRHLDASHRIKSRRNVDGFVPGEAASAVLLETEAQAVSRDVATDGVVSGVGLGSEPETFSSEKQSTGRGLTEALRRLFASPGGSGRAADFVLCDLNGESYRAVEWGLVLVRLGEDLAGIAKLCHPANCHGDIGAATGGALMAIATAAFRRGYAPSEEAILFCGSDGALRAAARIKAT
jgi:3-oxoacyl-[acyl-carrier-protein] synthase-1